MRCFVIKTKHFPRFYSQNLKISAKGLFERVFKKRVFGLQIHRTHTISVQKTAILLFVILTGIILITLTVKKQNKKAISVFNSYNADKIVSDVLPSTEEPGVISYIKEQISTVSKPQPGEIVKEYGGIFSTMSSPTPTPNTSPKPEKVTTEEKTSSSYDLLKNETDYWVQESLFENMPLKFSKSPKILLIHTHTTECYTTKETHSFNNNGRSTMESENMIAIGKLMKEEFEKHGVTVIHDTTFHDYPSYQGAYGRSLSTAKKHLSETDGIELILDIHRDAITTQEGNRVKLIKEINGEACAQLMLVCGTDSGGLSHPGWRDNLNFAVKLQQNMNLSYPGLMRPINLRKERFNQHLTPGSLIIEVGTHGNSLNEAKKSSVLIAGEICKLLIK